MRIDRYLAMQGLGSRSEVQRMLRAGRVTVDGQVVHSGAYVLAPSVARVICDGEPICFQQTIHLMMNKPAGYVTAAQDSRHQVVMELLPKRMASLRCMPVGRLDRDAEGLLLFTTDGALAHRLLSPKRHVYKQYYVEVDHPLESADIQAFALGIDLTDFVSLPATLEILPGQRSAHVTIREGKYHQVKRMFQARSATVTYLKRLAFGGLVLDEALAPGAWRELTAVELSALEASAKGAQNE